MTTTLSSSDVMIQRCDGIVLSSAYMGSVRYYAAMLAARETAVDASEAALTHAWMLNHCRICGANGVQQLVVPIDKTNFNAHSRMQDVVISNHGNWRHLHWGALFSSYGKTPFFDYIADDLERVIKGNQRYLIDLNAELQALVIDFLDLHISWSVADKMPHCDMIDLRGKVGDKRTVPTEPLALHDVPYYQLWASRTGFLPDLSIIDMLCNLGREAVFTLMAMSQPE